MIKNIKWLLLVTITIVACNSDDDNTIPKPEPVSPGSANFSKYVALGDSFTAGFSDNALFKKGQEGSFANVLATQFADAGGGEFKTPYMNDNIGGLLLQGNVASGTRLYFNGVGPVQLTASPTTEITTKLTGPFNNLGVPGAKSYHLITPNYGNVAGVQAGTANPYFARFASLPSTTVLADAAAQAPTFFSLWIGGNDVLGYATSGGTGINQTGNLNPATYATSDITDPTVFASAYSTLINTLTANGAKGCVAGLPYVTTLPHFTTVPFNPLDAKSIGKDNETIGLATIKSLNTQLYGPLKQILSAYGAGDRINLLSETGASPLLIKDETLPNLSQELAQALTESLGAQTAAVYGAIFGQARQAKSTDLILLPTRNAIGAAPTASDSGLGFAPTYPLNAFGISYPLQDKHVLIPSEIKELQIATDSYNTTIENIAKEKGLAYVDTRPTMNQLSNGGIPFGTNFIMSSTFVTGGAFSLDGIHPSPRGYALIANIFIDAINEKYGSTLRQADLTTKSIQFPAVLP